jgi:hypothetical protein
MRRGVGPARPAEALGAIAGWHADTHSEHQTGWQSVRYATNPATGTVRAITNSYVEITTGLKRRDAIGHWERASAAVQITATGAEANFASHRVTIAGNHNTAGAVLIEKDGVKMQGHPLCLAYYDPVDGRSLMLAELIDSVGWLVASNEVIFSNCFDTVRASMRYRNSINGLEQYLLLHERPAINPQDLGFSEKTRLELFTEWVGDSPVPSKDTRLLETEKNTEIRKQMAELDFTDSTRTFGSRRMPQGKAFTTSDEPAGPNAVIVGKRFEMIDGRKVVIEAVPVRRVQGMLDQLPVARERGTLTNAAEKPLSRPSDTLSPPRGEGRGEGLAALRDAIRHTTDQSIRWLPAKLYWFSVNGSFAVET